MTHLLYKDEKSTSVTKGMTVAIPATIIECPPLKPVALRLYNQTPIGLLLVAQFFSDHLPKGMKKPVTSSTMPSAFSVVRLVVVTQPEKTGFGKKQHDMTELQVSGKTPQDAYNYAKELLSKQELKVSDIFKEGQFVDVHGVTKGKGFQGTVKRYGVKIRQHKSEKTKRGIGTLGPWTPKRVLWTVAQAGKMGYHKRSEYNKYIIKINAKPEDINPLGGLVRYGLVKNEYLLLKGSVPGPKKRPILLTEPQRNPQYKEQITGISYIHKGSQQ